MVAGVEQYALRTGKRVTFNKEAKEKFLRFATSSRARWLGNFRDLSGAITRMATLAPGGWINDEGVKDEIQCLRYSWRRSPGAEDAVLDEFPGKKVMGEIDLFDQVRLAEVVRVCRRSNTLSEAGKTLFSATRKKKKPSNDADRLRKYLAKFGLIWSDLVQD